MCMVWALQLLPKGRGLRSLFFLQAAFSWRAALVPVVFPLSDPQSLPSWGLFHCSISTKIPGFQCIWHTVHPQPKQAPCKCTCRWHLCPFQQGTWKTAHPLCNLSQGLLYFGSSFHSYVHLGKDWGCNPHALCKPGAGMSKCKGRFLEQHSWWVLLCHGEKSLTSPTDTQSFTSFRHTSFLVHTFSPLCCLLPGGCEQALGETRNDSSWFCTSNPHIVRWIRWIHLRSDHIH